MKILNFRFSKKDVENLLDFHLNGIGGLILRSLVHGAVTKVLWMWFVEGTFSFIPHPSFLAFAGLYLIIVYVKHDYHVAFRNGHFHVEGENPDEETTRIRQVRELYKKMIVRSIAFLVAGAIIKILMTIYAIYF